MSHIFSYQFRRWSLTFVLLSTLAVISLCATNPSPEITESAPPFKASVFEIPSYQDPIEARLQSKGEKLLASLGEQSPVVVVTARVDHANMETKDISYHQDKPIVDSLQETAESLRRGEEPYSNQKKAVNYKVGERHIKTVSFGPRVEKIHCLALVSAPNESRCQEIEKALSVALGLDVTRGDQVQVMVK